MHINQLEMSDHAVKRIRQRGIKNSFVEFVSDEADALEYVGGAHSSFISKKKLKRRSVTKYYRLERQAV